MNLVKTGAWLLPLVLGTAGLAVAGVHGTAPAPNGGNDPTEGIDPAKISAEDCLSRSHQMQAQMGATEGRVAALQKRAEGKKDMVMVNCVADKLTQVKGYVAVGAAAGHELEVAAGRNDDGERVHHFERQTIVYQKVLILGTEAEGCAGEDVSYIGATQVNVEIDPNIPQNDPTIPNNYIPTADRPPEGNCPNS